MAHSWGRPGYISRARRILRVVAALANLPHRDGMVFRRASRRRKDDAVVWGEAYADRRRRYGGQIKRGWEVALRRAELDPELTPHDLRHTWPSWHYALHKNLILLQQEGGWSSVTLVTRYAHLLPVGHEAAIHNFWAIAGACINQSQMVTWR